MSSRRVDRTWSVRRLSFVKLGLNERRRLFSFRNPLADPPCPSVVEVRCDLGLLSRLKVERGFSSRVDLLESSRLKEVSERSLRERVAP